MAQSLLHLFADVGGTFTDCIFWQPPKTGCQGRGTFTIRKILSSGSLPLSIQPSTDRRRIRGTGLPDMDTGFWIGWKLAVHRSDTGEYLARITDFNASDNVLCLDRPLPENIPSDTPARLSSGESAVVTALRCLTETKLSAALPPAVIRYATTVGTNTLLERNGPSTVFVTTRGFEDTLEIGYQDRPELFQLHIRKPPVLAEHTLGIAERIDASGRIRTPVNTADVEHALKRLHDTGAETIAVCLMNAWVNPDHELTVGRLAAKAGFKHIHLSHRSSPRIRLIPRADTTVTDAYLTPVLQDHLQSIRDILQDTGKLSLMTSAGGLTVPEQFTGRRSILSGPAGGMVALSDVARVTGFPKIIGFDMGGTSTDVSRYDGEFEYRYETRISGIRLTTPMLHIETVAAGGGSICHFDGTRLRVGPESAGSEPGPASYGRGGPLTLTDVNALLGYLPRFPFPLNMDDVRDRFETIRESVGSTSHRNMRIEEIAEGFRTIACETMAAAIRKISLARGYDVREYVLSTFGGAGPQHACSLARLLDIDTIVIHPLASVLSAYGLCVAPVKTIVEQPVMELFRDRYIDEWETLLTGMHASAEEEILDEDIDPDTCRCRTLADVRYLGQTHVLTLPFERVAAIPERFEDAHRREYGYCFQGRGIEITAFRLELSGDVPTPELPRFKRASEPAVATELRSIHLNGQSVSVPVYSRESVRPGHILQGPCLLAGPDTSVLIETEWHATVDHHLNLILKRRSPGMHRNTGTESHAQAPDPVLLEVYHHRFAAIASQMGIVLRKTALSTNIKERLDFSCAVFTGDGRLVANAPHIPVHLGAMGRTVREMMTQFPVMHAGDVFVTNDPYRGGSHLPDVTVVMPVFVRGSCRFFTAVRAHHAEIGGIVPGSMPADAHTLSREGVVIPPVRLMSRGRPALQRLRRILSGAPWPSRAPEDNISDILAQAAACRRGASLLKTLCRRQGIETVTAYMGFIRTASGRAMSHALDTLPGTRRRRFIDRLDDGTPISVTIDIHHGIAHIDFSGTGPVSKGNLNANPAIVQSAVMYCLRCLLTDDVPLNEGIMDSVKINLPPCILNPPVGPEINRQPAVSGGNVETSQRICDAVFGALGVTAASQGTMNNISFGTAHYSYYETIGGGSGAGPGFNGAHGVQVHMTNTRITDPEVVERRYPVTIERFAIRRNSGGKGEFRGGDGLIREYVFHDAMDVSILSERRGTNVPYGLNGGQPGQAGRNILIRAGGDSVELGAKTRLSVASGDRLIIETPGGGGYGNPL